MSGLPVMGKRARKRAKQRAVGQSHRPRNQKLFGDKLTYIPRQNGFLMPPCLRTRLRSSLYGYTSSGAGTGSYAWGMTLNSLYHPWNTATWSGLTPVGSAFATLAPGGFSQLCNVNFYQSYRVISSVISVNVTPQSVTDSVRIAIVPTNNLGAVLADLVNQRYAKIATLAANRPLPSRDGLVNRMKVAKFIGVPAQAIEYDLSFNYAGTYTANPVKLLYWAIGLNTGDNAVLTNPLEVAITVTWEVEFFNFAADLISDSLAEKKTPPPPRTTGQRAVTITLPMDIGDDK